MAKQTNLTVQRRITRFFAKEERGKLVVTDERLVPFIDKLVEIEMTIRLIEEDP